jgi:hypothetical protein
MTAPILSQSARQIKFNAGDHQAFGERQLAKPVFLRWR